MATIAIDAGHGGYDGGAAFNGRLEKDDNLKIALAVGSILENNGIDVVYTRTTDVYDSPLKKAQIANNSGADIFVSFHRNSSPVPDTYSGVETLIYDNGGIKESMAQNINSELEKVGFADLGINLRPDLAVLRRTEMPSLLVELGFINTSADNNLLDNSFDASAEAIATGILNTLAAYGMLENAPITSPSYDEPPAIMVPGQPLYQVQTGLFRIEQNAYNLASELNALGFSTDIIPMNGYYAVRVGNETSLEAGAELESELRMLGYPTLLIEHRM